MIARNFVERSAGKTTMKYDWKTYTGIGPAAQQSFERARIRRAMQFESPAGVSPARIHCL